MKALLLVFLILVLDTPVSAGYGEASVAYLDQDYQAASKWHRLAAEQGHAEAQNNLGLMYLNGEGVTQSKTSAYMWLYNAASQGVRLAKWSQHEL